MEIFMKRYVLMLFVFLQTCHIQSYCQAFFAPIDNLTTLLIEKISAEKKSIYGAVYMLTDKKISQALIDAKKRGVDVQIIIDQISMCSCGKGKFLQEAGVPVFVHRTQEFNPYTMPLMHHKFFVFGCNADNKALLWTGSWNCTVRGTQHNDENVILVDDPAAIQHYLVVFEQLKKRLL
jgi:phosphatidylserine/phosphatidylglycerophosphate/cardiolipin synthase-like enzyme